MEKGIKSMKCLKSKAHTSIKHTSETLINKRPHYTDFYMQNSSHPRILPQIHELFKEISLSPKRKGSPNVRICFAITNSVFVSRGANQA